MKYIYPYLTIFLFSCYIRITPKIDYLGEKYLPTKEVDVFVDENNIEHKYKVIGKGYPRLSPFQRSVEKLQKKVVEKAKKIGADAVLIKDYYIPNTGVQANSTFLTDSLGKGTITTGNTTITSTGSSGFSVFFLKYSFK